MSDPQQTQHPEWLQTIITPVSDEDPCGENPEYDAQFILLLSQLEPRMGAEYGSFVEAAEPINWVDVERECRRLLCGSKDIRVILIFIRCMVRQRGPVALAEGLEALLAALKMWPDSLHPQLAEEGEFDPVMRANALAELTAHAGLMSDLRQITLPGVQGIYPTVRDIEKALQIPREEGALPIQTLDNLLQTWQQNPPPDILAFQRAARYLHELELLMAETLQDEAPDISKLRLLMTYFTPRHASESLVPPQLPQEAGLYIENSDHAQAAVDEPLSVHETPSAPQRVHAEVHRTITSRHDALNQIQELRAWFTRTEPSSPADGLLHLTEQIIGKSFSDLFKLLPQELIVHLTTRQD